ncbi:MAG: hypothetical protein HYW34_03355 [Candidatus Brennerbacteria bacterium]|nr:hypothetical protein [Candidatus Brennerbacteria bacterium]
MKSNKSTYIYVILGIVVLAGLFIYPRFKKEGGGTSGFGSDVPCLLPNASIVQHTHQQLTITVDDKSETVPGDIGLTGCHRAIHTHDGTGEIHVEAQDKRDYTLGDFFKVWGKTIEREGYDLEMNVDGLPVSFELRESLVLKDKQQIILNYTKKVADKTDL